MLARRIKNRLSKEYRKRLRKLRTFGRVEALGLSGSRGWAIGRVGESRDISVELDGATYELSAAWMNRGDIAQNYFTKEMDHGFSVHFPAELRAKLYADPDSLGRLILRCGGHKLRHAHKEIGAFRGPGASREADQKSILRGTMTIVHDGSTAELRALGVECFVVYGAYRGDLQLDDLVLRHEGKTVDCNIFGPLKPSESSYAPEVGGEERLFEVELPPLFWENVSELPVRLELGSKVGDESIDLELTEQELVRWLGLTFGGIYSNEPYWSFLCLEHLRACPALVSLSAERKNAIGEFTERYRMRGYLPGHFAPDRREEFEKEVDRREEKGDPISGIVGEFNEKLPEYEGREGELAAKLLERYRPSDKQRFRVLCLLSSHFCLNDDVGTLVEVIGKKVISAPVEEIPWSMSAALGYLTYEGKFGVALDILRRLGFDEAFVSMPIRYAVERVLLTHKSERTRSHFVAAYLIFLERLNLNFWARLSDIRLIEAAVSCLEHREKVNEDTRDKMNRLLFQTYGQNPNFWSILASRIDLSCLPKQFAEGFAQFQLMEEALASNSPLVNTFERLMRANRFFLNARTKNAVSTQRQLLSAGLSDAATNHVYRDLIEDIIRKDASRNETEFLRYRAQPTGLAEDQLVELDGDLYEGLRVAYLNRGHASPTYPKQREAFGAYCAPTPDLKSVLELSQEINTSRCNFLGVDLLSGLLVQNPENQEVKRAYDEALAHATGEGVPAAPVQAARARIERHQNPSPDGLQIESGDELVGDTLVVVYSCKPNLETHIPNIRQTWLKTAREHGMRGMVVVGDGDGKLEGDVLALDVKDDYENLPWKTLELFRWVVDNTDIQYLVKIDDDCSLRVEEYLSGLAYRKHHYHGRSIPRSPGQTDRRWHQLKSSTPLARAVLDKLPEPCIFADGGSAYAVSRHAMKTALAVLETQMGARLAASTFAEDRLLGYLLSLGNVKISRQDHYVHVFRKTKPDGSIISRYVTTFHGTQLTPTQVTHLDGPDKMAETQELAGTRQILPKRIWPGYHKPTVGFCAQQLELLSPTDQATKLGQKKLFVVSVMYNEVAMVPLFLEHYRKLGVEAFVIADNASDDGTREYLLEQEDVILYSNDTSYRDARFGIMWQQAMLDAHCLGRWAAVVDADEFLVFPDSEKRSLAEYIAELEDGGYNASWQALVDMYPHDDLADADFTTTDPFEAAPYHDKTPLTPWRLNHGQYSSTNVYVSSLRHRLIKDSAPHMYTSQKHALFRHRPWIRVSQGLHCVANINPAPAPSALAHFKYHSGFKAKVDAEVNRGEHYNNGVEYRRYQALLAETRGGFRTDELSTRFTDSKSFLAPWSDWSQAAPPPSDRTETSPKSEGDPPFIIWTMRRTGGTNLTKFLTKASSHMPVEHEPFNKPRMFGDISNHWNETRDEDALRKSLREKLQKRILIKHCLDVAPKKDPVRFNLILLEVSLEFGYRHIFLYRETASDRLLSLNYSQKTGNWGKGLPNIKVDQGVSDPNEINVERLVNGEEKAREKLRRVHDELVCRGQSPLSISFEQMFLTDIHASRALVLDLLKELGINPAHLTSETEQTLFQGGRQGTSSKYMEFKGAENLVEQAAALGPLRFHHPLQLGTDSPDLNLRLVQAAKDLHYILLGEPVDAPGSEWTVHCGGGQVVAADLLSSDDGSTILRSQPFIPPPEFELRRGNETIARAALGPSD